MAKRARHKYDERILRTVEIRRERVMILNRLKFRDSWKKARLCCEKEYWRARQNER